LNNKDNVSFHRDELIIEFTDTTRPQYIGFIKSKLMLAKFNRINIVSFSQFSQPFFTFPL